MYDKKTRYFVKYKGDTRYEKVWEQMQLLGIEDITTKRQSENGKVYQYSIDYENYFKSDHEDFCPYETFMESKGHKVNNCEWMIHEEGGVEFNIQ